MLPPSHAFIQRTRKKYSIFFLRFFFSYFFFSFFGSLQNGRSETVCMGGVIYRTMLTLKLAARNGNGYVKQVLYGQCNIPMLSRCTEIHWITGVRWEALRNVIELRSTNERRRHRPVQVQFRSVALPPVNLYRACTSIPKKYLNSKFGTLNVSLTRCSRL